MIYRELGHSGIEVSAVAFGAWAIGGWMWGGKDDKKAVAAIHAAIDQGITLIDTAPAYGYGHSEGARRPGHRRAAKQGRAGHQVRPDLGPRRRDLLHPCR